MIDTEQPDEHEQHEPGFPCPVCHVITIQQPWPSLIALGMKHWEFRTQPRYYQGPVVIHAGKVWYPGGVRKIVTMHFRKYARHPEEVMQALFPVARPVAEAVVQDCKRWSETHFALSLKQVRIITRPKPVLKGLQAIIWETAQTKELAEALSRARVLEGAEKNAVYQEFELLALRSKLNTWLRGEGLGDFQLTAPSK
jgi:hypothetical protein